jgi:hypothetical protein
VLAQSLVFYFILFHFICFVLFYLMLANKQCIMIEGHWFNNSKIFSLLKNLEDTKLRIFFHNPDLTLGRRITSRITKNSDYRRAVHG